MKFGIIAAMEEEKRLLEEEMTIEKKMVISSLEQSLRTAMLT